MIDNSCSGIRTEERNCDSAKADRGLPHESEQEEQNRNDRQDVNQRTKGLIGLGQLGQQIECGGGHPGDVEGSFCGRYHV